MNRKEFGELVAALRQDLGWTQFQLAEYAELDEAVVSQIERGVKKHFEPDLLFRLANAFQLTSLERQDFVLAASGLDEKQIVRQPSAITATDVFDATKILEQMVALTSDIRVPAFLVDVYSDVIAANRMILAFYDVPPSMIETAANIPGGYNTTRLNFGRDLVGRKIVTDNWDHYALNSMRSFRENNVKEYPFFDRYWKLVTSTEQDKQMKVDHFSFRHNVFGPLKYIASMTTTVTSFGNLFLVQNLPLDEHTDEAFAQLKFKAGTGVIRFAPWPEKPMP
jgi:transcriptional regulator with XRE-family HTH domain